MLSQLMALQTATTEATASVALRGHGDHISASQLQSRAEALGNKLEALLAVGFPDEDPEILDLKELVKTQDEMPEVSQYAITLTTLPCLPMSFKGITSHLQPGSSKFKEQFTGYDHHCERAASH